MYYSCVQKIVIVKVALNRCTLVMTAACTAYATAHC